ncbi:MAG: FAD-dependent oxidoreductase [Dehalococcoidales bacterium]|nr:FAD-dependent oxidoreductase [Dehalococcoidales bacterium]
MQKLPSQTEVIVIGSGAAGLSAAVTAAGGGAGVVVFEKQRSLGGTSNFLQGTFAVESRMQRERYITYSRDDAFKSIMEYSHWRANPRLVRAIVNESPYTIEWLQKQGVVFLDATINMIDSPRTYHVIKGNGDALIKALALSAREKGVDIRPGVRVVRILKRGERISGVMVEENGEEWQVAASVVIVASGGYANDEALIKKYSGFDLGVNIIPIGNTEKTGDGIRMAWEAGAAEEGMGVLEVFRTGPVSPEIPLGSLVEFPATQPDLWVDPSGQRFCDESIAFYDTTIGNVNCRYKEGYTFSIFDDSVIQRISEYGLDKGVKFENPPGCRPQDLEKELNTLLARESSEIFAAASVEELAQKIGAEPDVLKATVEEYNSFCWKGHDDLFAKDPRFLRPIIGPEFYAVKARTLFLGTMGGIKINSRAEVIDKNGRVIPGLYAGGFDAGGIYGDSYPIQCASGLSSSFALNSGRIAGKNALKYLGKQL